MSRFGQGHGLEPFGGLNDLRLRARARGKGDRSRRDLSSTWGFG